MCLLIDTVVKAGYGKLKKVNKSLIAITLLVFMGQSYAALLMSCDISMNPITKEAVSINSHSLKDQIHQHHADSNQNFNKNYILDKISYQQNCDSEQHDCQCSLGTCSTVFLPVNAYTHLQSQVNRVNSPANLNLDFQPFLLYRPPISA